MKRLYVIIRKDLSAAQQAVQAGHAIEEWMRDWYPQNKSDGTLIYLVAELEEMHDLMSHLCEEGYEVSAFYEPDIGNQMTAIACLATKGTFKNLEML